MFTTNILESTCSKRYLHKSKENSYTTVSERGIRWKSTKRLGRTGRWDGNGSSQNRFLCTFSQIVLRKGGKYRLVQGVRSGNYRFKNWLEIVRTIRWNVLRWRTTESSLRKVIKKTDDWGNETSRPLKTTSTSNRVKTWLQK